MKAQDIERETSKEIASDSQILSPSPCPLLLPPSVGAPGECSLCLSSSKSGLSGLHCERPAPGSFLSSPLPPETPISSLTLIEVLGPVSYENCLKLYY